VRTLTSYRKTRVNARPKVSMTTYWLGKDDTQMQLAFWSLLVASHFWQLKSSAKIHFRIKGNSVKVAVHLSILETKTYLATDSDLDGVQAQRTLLIIIFPCTSSTSYSNVIEHKLFKPILTYTNNNNVTSTYYTRNSNMLVKHLLQAKNAPLA
jgi:hypothetical protein